MKETRLVTAIDQYLDAMRGAHVSEIKIYLNPSQYKSIEKRLVNGRFKGYQVITTTGNTA